MAINPGSVDQQFFTAQMYGFRLDKATAALPASAYGALATVTGGRIIIRGFIGQVTTIIQAQATTCKITATPTTGTAVDLCSTLDLTGKEAGCLLGITGTFATALVGANAGATVMCATPVIINIGTVGLTTVATSTGSIKWSIFWEPLDDGAVLA